MKRQLLVAQLASEPWAMHPVHLANFSAVVERWASGESASTDIMDSVRAAQADRAKRRDANTQQGNIAVLNCWGSKARPITKSSSG